ncbi:nicotinate phosphoribosyltransferase [Cohnella cholangitidis]|uniref:Nicotinate phosphoribosyltransferase n=1 Tax=Cohnella cholangitidis TaxID=2598458 RepID=A0A7G5C4G6_9BACL|nr:nicotinate phosphoribosyltransferase [Cohnella cholangitidis]QMV44100.1 nicotinate phosphoribosyltransferase [Cohnella cholangitidis]
MNSENLTLHTDKYQINMMYAHWKRGSLNDRAVFEAYFRKLPFGNGFAVFAGLERIVGYIRDLTFDDEAIGYLRVQEENYEEGFLEELRRFRFTGNLYAMREGTIVFPNEPLIRVEARIFEAQLIETAMLNFLNYQTLVATKASRIKQAAPNDLLLEFGTRRAQEADAAIWGARAAYVAGFHATSNMRAGMIFGIPTSGTHAHSWVQGHDSEEEAFRQFAEALPDHVILLVDTFDTLRSGVPNAIRIAAELKRRGKSLKAIRLDSGDLAYLSKRARIMLDEAGFPDVKIVASNDLDENIIAELKAQGAQIDSWGVGTQLITAFDQPSLGGVYKLVAREKNGQMLPVIKISGNPEKISNPGIKDVYRIVSKKTGMAEADYICMPEEEDIRAGTPIRLFDPLHAHRFKIVDDYAAIPMLQPIFVRGNPVYELPTLDDVRSYHRDQLALFWPEHLRKLNPEMYRVNFSRKVIDRKLELLQRYQEQ